MPCQNSTQFVSNRQQVNFSQLFQNFSQYISRLFSILPQFGIPDNQLVEKRAIEFSINQVNMQYTSIENAIENLVYILGPNRVIMLNSDTISHPSNEDILCSGNSVGSYHYRSGSIFLDQNLWCRSSTLHEYLHSVSLFAKHYGHYTNRGWNNQKHFREGLTELFGGYYLSKIHQMCYNNWIKDHLLECRVSYRPYLKIWCSICQVFSINEIAAFYFSHSGNLIQSWDNYLLTIRNKGYPNFNYSISYDSYFNYSDFEDVCFESIKDFELIFDDDKKAFDFTRIP